MRGPSVRSIAQALGEVDIRRSSELPSFVVRGSRRDLAGRDKLLTKTPRGHPFYMLECMKQSWLIVVLALGLVPRLAAQIEDAQNSECEPYLKVPLPVEASKTPSPTAWPACDSYKFYSGIGRRVDFEAARQCAWKERLAQQENIEPRYTVASVFGGSAMLAVLYANGEGVSRDMPLAIRFSCEAGGAPAEISVRMRHLQALVKESSKSASAFDFCGDITSGFMEGFCAARSSEIRDQKRTGSLDALAASFAPEQRKTFSVLRQLEEAYSVAHAKGEVDLSGTARAMYQIDAEDTLHEDFLAALETFEAGRFPSGSAVQYEAADAHLNRAYRKALNDARAHKDESGAIQPEGIRDAERAWLKYRDAWITFAKLRYSSVPTEAWLVLLTNDRTSILDGSFCDMDAEDGPCAQKGDTWKPSPLP